MTLRTFHRRLVVGAVLLAAGGVQAAEFRTFDGHGNNPASPELGVAGAPLIRLLPDAYDDGAGAPRGSLSGALPSARAVSNAVAARPPTLARAAPMSDWLWQWGQFQDHDLDLVEAAVPADPFPIPVPAGDPFFDPMGLGTAVIGLNRSAADSASGVRQQINSISAFIDGSVVYGSDPARAAFLRDAGGRLKVSLAANGETLLPFNTAGLPNAMAGGGDPQDFFIGGDVRANEQIGLTAAHTLFVREHNRIADILDLRLGAGDAALVPSRDASGLPDDEFIYQSARKLVGAQIQKISYEEFLPALLGADALGPYLGYDPLVDPGISNAFATAAYRVGHTMLSPSLLRVDSDGNVVGEIALRDAFFNPAEIVANGVDTLLMGLASKPAQAVDTHVVDDVRNFLFGPPGAGGFDLAALNIQRGRDHGLPGYNAARQALGLAPIADFSDLTPDAALAAAFRSVYASVDDIDLWIGALAEIHVPGALVGETFWHILVDQFRRLRDGDRHFYLAELDHLHMLDPQFMRRTTLASLIERNTGMSMPADAFRMASSVDAPASLVLLAAGILGALAAPASRRRRCAPRSR